MSVRRSSMVVMASSMLVYLISFANQLLIAKKFGTGVRLDAYFAATNIPLAVSNLIGACFTYAVVPSLVRNCLEKENRKSLLSGFFLSLLCVSVGFLMIGLSVPSLGGQYWEQFGYYAREAKLSGAIAWATAGVFCLTALSDALYNATGKFQFPVLAYLPSYILTALACLIFGGEYGGVALAFAILLGYLVMWPKRLSDQISEVRDKPDFEYAKSTLKQVPTMLLAVSSLYAFPVVDSILGPAAGEGIVSILGMSARLVSTLGVIIALGPFGVAIPALSELSRDGKPEEFITRSLRYLRVAMTVLALITGWLVALRTPIIQLLFERGRFTPQSTAQLSDLMKFTIPGAFFMICSMLLVRLLAADGRLSTAAKTGLLGVLVYAVGFAGLSRYGESGIGLANGLAWLIYFVAIFTLFVRPHRAFFSTPDNIRYGTKLLGGFLISFGLSFLSGQLVPRQSLISPILGLFLSMIGFGLYAKLSGLQEFEVVARPVLSRLRSLRKTPSNSQ